MDSEIRRDIPVLTALVRVLNQNPHLTPNMDQLAVRLHSDRARTLARAIVSGSHADPRVLYDVAELRRLALGKAELLR